MGARRIFFIIISLFIVFLHEGKLEAKGVSLLESNSMNLEEIESWASSFFVGPPEFQHFEINETQVVVVVGQRTSGIVTSEVFVFSESRKDCFRLVVYRNKVMGIATARQKGKKLEFVTWGVDKKERVFLIIPENGF